MNERIKLPALKLPAQEWLGYDPERGDLHGYTFEQMREFAELIIQDCLTQVAMIGISNFEDDDHGDISWTISKCIEMIKYRFEIKE
jgi:hypothetical protein